MAPVGDIFGCVHRLEPFAKGGHEQRPNKKCSRFLGSPYMASILVLSAARAVRDRLFFPLNELRAHCADARSVFRHPAAVERKTLERSGADVPVDALGIEGREAMVRGMPIQDGLSMNVIEEGGRVARREFAVAEPDLKTLVGNRVENGSRMRMLHPEDLDEVVHLGILFRPPVECDTWIVVLVTRHVSRRPSNRARGDHRSKSAEHKSN